jgi:hypothetical protein
MTNVLELIYSIPFLAGGLVGALGMKLYQRAVCRHLDKTHPLPSGERRRIPGLSRTWLGGLLTFAVLGYVLLQVNQTEAHYRQLGDEMRHCQIEFNAALNARAAITTENDELSRQQRDLLAESDEAESIWIDRLINLPEDIAGLPSTDDRVQQWGKAVTRVYFERIGHINAKITAISDRQQQLEQDRRNHPLPEPSCGH